MNMPLKPDGTVSFTATLFAVIRTSLRIKVTRNFVQIPPDKIESSLVEFVYKNWSQMDGPIDACNDELKAIVLRIWKRTPEAVIDAIFPPKGSGSVIRPH